MLGYAGPFEALAKGNRNFRRVPFTAGTFQLVPIALSPSEEIGSKVHAAHDRVFRIEKGHGEIRIDGARAVVKTGGAIVISACGRHNLINSGKRRLRLGTPYSPPQHADGLVEATQAIADQHEAGRASVPSPVNPSR